MENLKEVMLNKVSRRKFISGVSAGMGAAAAVSFAAGCGGSSTTTVTTTATTTVTTTATTAPTSSPTSSSTSTGVTDADILTFALNLEYLEASYYLIGTTGTGLAATDMGTGTGLGSVTGGSKVNFTNTAYQYYANEIAQQELTHVQFLRAALTKAGATVVPMPNIDLMNSFNMAASAAGIGSSFNPFASQEDFILGAFVFEDVGVTAYHGAAPLITTPAYLEAAGGIYAVEAYHAGVVRTILLELGGAYVTNANQISALRGAASASVTGTSGASGAAETTLSTSSIVAADSNSLTYDRSTDQVLHIVYLNATPGVVKSGGFFPNGLNGTITASAS